MQYSFDLQTQSHCSSPFRHCTMDHHVTHPWVTNTADPLGRAAVYHSFITHRLPAPGRHIAGSQTDTWFSLLLPPGWLNFSQQIFSNSPLGWKAPCLPALLSIPKHQQRNLTFPATREIIFTTRKRDDSVLLKRDLKNTQKQETHQVHVLEYNFPNASMLLGVVAPWFSI